MIDHYKLLRYSLFIGIILITAFIPVDSLAQKGILSGYIYDNATGDPLPYATISKVDSNIGTTSSGDGSYSLMLDEGIVNIRYDFLSYQDTVITIEIEADKETKRDIYLHADTIEMDEFTVNADRVAKIVQDLAEKRDQKNKNLNSYQADVYKLAILSSVEEGVSTSAITKEQLEPMAFSERYAEISYMASPERYYEVVKANRASENFFSEYDFFSAGGGPLNLNQDEVPLSILSESITVVGPVSSKAGKFYDLYDEEADSSWPKGTVEIYFEPMNNKRALFKGKIWFNKNTSNILGIDVSLNDYASTNTGTFQVSDFRYKQTYHQIGEFWLPQKTEMSAIVSFIVSNSDIFYHDVWTWSNFEVNTNKPQKSEFKLSTSVISDDAYQKENTFWDSLSTSSTNENVTLLQEAKEYEEDNISVRLAMLTMRSLYRLPYQLERFYLTNFSDIYHYNRVEGHYLGLGLRTPVHTDYDYRIAAGYGFGNESISYKVSGHHFIGNSFVAPEFIYRKETVPQYQDYEYNRTPIDFFEARQTFNALVFGRGSSNYFEREGFEAGLRLRYDIQSFLRVLYVDEEHHNLQAQTDYNIWGNEILPENYRNNDLTYPAQEGRVKGLNIRFHHDTRQYSRNQFLRDYNIRKFGWLSDIVLEKGISNWGSDFDYNRYRVGLKFYWPIFTSHFFQTDITFGATNSGVPNHRMFSYNGFVVDDYVRYRPFNTISYREPLGNRFSEVMIRYKLGTSLTRKIPIDFISKSGVKLSTFFTAGLIDKTATLEPLLPYSDSQAQVEIGIAASKIFGFFYVEFSKRLYGKFGNSVGFTARF